MFMWLQVPGENIPHSVSVFQNARQNIPKPFATTQKTQRPKCISTDKSRPRRLQGGREIQGRKEGCGGPYAEVRGHQLWKEQPEKFMAGVSFDQRRRKGLTGASPHHPEHHEKITTGFLYREERRRLPEWTMLKHKVFWEAQELDSAGNRKARGKTLRTGSPIMSDRYSLSSAKT